MKILLCAYECDPERGSEYGRGWNWAFSYAKQGHEVYCLTSKRGKKGIEKTLRQLDINNLHFVFVTVHQRLEKNYGKSTIWVYWHYWQWLKNAYKAAQHLNQSMKFDYAHHVSWGSIQQGTSLWRLKIPLVFGPVGGGQFAPEQLKPYFLEGWGVEKKRKLISNLLLRFNKNTKKTLQQSSLILVDNYDTKLMAERLNARNIVLINDPNIKPEDIQETVPSKSPSPHLRLIWVGRLLFRKGLPLVLEALSRVPAEIPVKLTIYGDGPVGKHLPDMIDKFDIKEKVNWRGQVSHDEVKAAYLQNDVFIFCPLRETLGEQFFEAMAYSLPIITLNLHGAKTAVPEEGGIKAPVSTRDHMLNHLVSAIVFLYKHPETRISMGEFNFAYVKDLALTDKVKLVHDKLRNNKDGQPI